MGISEGGTTSAMTGIRAQTRKVYLKHGLLMVREADPDRDVHLAVTVTGDGIWVGCTFVTKEAFVEIMHKWQSGGDWV